jgi:L-alanine-DL-glutamate epimerase-like enolase superfamily enzyme
MARIVNVEPGFYRIPLPAVLSDSTHGFIEAFELLTVRVRDADGAEGVGYTYTVGRNGAAVRAGLREIASIVAGADAAAVEALWHRLWWALHYGGRGGPVMLALSAFDIALWDLKAKRAGVPLWQALGGFDPHVPCYAGGVDLELPLQALLAQTDANLNKGFRAIKMKVGRARLAEDVARVRAMRDHLGDGFPLMVDANMKWTADVAIAAARAFVPFGLVWLEEPIEPDDVAAHARVLRDGGLPIATGENLHTPWEFRQLIASCGVSYPEPDVTNCGGVTAFLKIAHLAEMFGLPVTSHGAHDLTVHLLAAVPNRSYLEVHGFGLERYVAEPLAIKEGFAVAPDRPGHGIGFDWAGLARLTA